MNKRDRYLLKQGYEAGYLESANSLFPSALCGSASKLADKWLNDDFEMEYISTQASINDDT